MIAGITGHQDLGDDQSQQWITQQIESWLVEHPVSIGCSSLAIGADQLFADCILKHEWALHAILPCSNYESTFKCDNTLANFTRLLRQAAVIVRLPYSHPSEDAFWAGGRWIVEHSDIVLAIWDGKPAKGLGGTGDAVAYARKLNKAVWHINPVNRTINSKTVERSTAG